MIEIVTLFIALVLGPQTVEFDVSPDVDQVEIILDGEVLGRHAGPPWVVHIDLGTQLLSHRLEVVALDAEGRELDRAVRFINLGHQVHGGRMVLLEGDSGRPEAVSLRWESVGQREPVGLEVSLDGQPIEATNPRRIPLPDYDPDEFHFVSAVLHFQDGGAERMQAGFGGQVGLEVSTELTAVPVVPSTGKKPPKDGHLTRAFRQRDDQRHLRVHGIEKLGAEVIFVRDAGVQPVLDTLVRQLNAGPSANRFERRIQRDLRREHGDSAIVLSQNFIRLGTLPLGTTMRLLAPRAAPLAPIGVSPEMFLISSTTSDPERGLLAAAVDMQPQQFEKQLAGAVALAGLIAQGSNRPRAVVLLLGEGGQDVSFTSPESARGYLEDLGVPFFVWAFEPLPEDSRWGPIQSLGTPDRVMKSKKALEAAIEILGENLESQRLVWLEGSHLPREVELAPGVDGIELAGRGTNAGTSISD